MRGNRHGNWLSDVPIHNSIQPLPMTPLTEEEIKAEKIYRIEERLGILCGDDIPTDEQMEIAIREANEWEDSYRKQIQ